MRSLQYNNMDRNLNEIEIAVIHDYLHKKGIVYHDFKVEMVDHLASTIEQQ